MFPAVGRGALLAARVGRIAGVGHVAAKVASPGAKATGSSSNHWPVDSTRERVGAEANAVKPSARRLVLLRAGFGRGRTSGSVAGRRFAALDSIATLVMVPIPRRSNRWLTWAIVNHLPTLPTAFLFPTVRIAAPAPPPARMTFSGGTTDTKREHALHRIWAEGRRSGLVPPNVQVTKALVRMELRAPFH